MSVVVFFSLSRLGVAKPFTPDALPGTTELWDRRVVKGKMEGKDKVKKEGIVGFIFFPGSGFLACPVSVAQPSGIALAPRVPKSP